MTLKKDKKITSYTTVSRTSFRYSALIALKGLSPILASRTKYHKLLPNLLTLSINFKIKIPKLSKKTISKRYA